jgi:hypothetical protein
MENTKNKTLRFKFSEDFVSELNNFSQIHKHDDSKTFKEAWEKWSEVNRNLINDEINILNNNGYVGNIADKMYKSARYYYKNKSNKKETPKERRKYTSFSREIISIMDEHIESEMENRDYTPAYGYENFTNSLTDEMKEQIDLFKNTNNVDNNFVKKKLKKTYKNRYYLKTH